jgi:hypothetical protein
LLLTHYFLFSCFLSFKQFLLRKNSFLLLWLSHRSNCSYKQSFPASVFTFRFYLQELFFLEGISCCFFCASEKKQAQKKQQLIPSRKNRRRKNSRYRRRKNRRWQMLEKVWRKNNNWSLTKGTVETVFRCKSCQRKTINNVSGLFVHKNNERFCWLAEFGTNPWTGRIGP